MKKIFGNEIGSWTINKLECIKNYLNTYSIILSAIPYYKNNFYYIDCFAGTGCCVCRETREVVSGSAVIALSIKHPFTKYFFFEIDDNKIKSLKEIQAKWKSRNIEIINGDCNTEIQKILIKIEDKSPFLSLLDPQAGDLKWNTLIEISKKSKAEVLINFPLGMAINRNLPLRSGEAISDEKIKETDEIFGNNDWINIYNARKNDEINPFEARQRYLDLYLKGLEEIGFKYYGVKNIIHNGRHLYFIIFASKHRKGLEIMKDILMKGETDRDNLLFLIDLKSELVHKYSKQKVTVDQIIENLLPGKHYYKRQDFIDALNQLEKENKLVRVQPRSNARSFIDTDQVEFS